MDALFDLSGRVTLITGAAGGLGEAISEVFCRQGAAVVMSDLDLSACEAAAARLRDDGHTVEALACDLSRSDAIGNLAQAAEASHGQIDVLVCNAGVTGTPGPIGETGETEWQQVMGINLYSALRLTSHVVPGMARRGGGSVILISSIAGLRGNRAIGLYAISKAGLAALARNLAVEWGPSGVRVNAIAPGLIRTPMSRGLMGDAGFMQRRLAATPLRRVGEPHEIAGVALLLASPAGGFITGQTLVVDGGTLISDGS